MSQDLGTLISDTNLNSLVQISVDWWPHIALRDHPVSGPCAGMVKAIKGVMSDLAK